MVIPGEMKDWADLWHSKQVAAKWSRKLEKQVDEYFTQLYVQRWNQAGPREMLQSIPYVAMWDDHDITDGWGSYPQDLHECDVYQNLFRLATRYYRLFQQQLAEDEVHPLRYLTRVRRPKASALPTPVSARLLFWFRICAANVTLT